MKQKTTYRISDHKGNELTISTTRGEDFARKQFPLLCPWGDPNKLYVSRRCSREPCRNFTAHANGVCSRHQSKEK
ncbi:MAG: hypothetical protein WC729_29930 [Sphingomonas sp.]|uniref:hypothetical protein n=1 Tax=Sphingomonas sp. TaxID=28214 RepID=UPI0035619367